MVYKDKEEILNNEIVKEVGGEIQIYDLNLFRTKMIDNLIDTIVLSESPYIKKICYWVSYEAALKWGIIPSSIQSLYEARAIHSLTHFTVPAINLRTLTFDLARAVFRAAKKLDAGTFIFEIAKSEIGYTDQRPWEYTSLILLAGIKEEFKGPIFLQGDHFQVKAKNFHQDRDKEISQLKDLIREAISAGFYNIDIDSSTLVDLSQPTIDAQQSLNYQVCALLTEFIRSLQPKGIEISVGGEIGEVGGKNSTPEELHSFMKGYLAQIKGIKGISKISIQTGTTHGGVVLPDGSIAKVKIDFDTLKLLSEIARRDYKMAGAVQHGASTLPNEAFHRFPEVGCAEIHLATQFQNIVYDYLPLSLKEEIYTWLNGNCAEERKPDWTDDQFIYKTRKKALGPFKKEIYSIPRELREKISNVLEKEFLFLFEQLRIHNTRDIIEAYIHPVVIKKEKSIFNKN